MTRRWFGVGLFVCIFAATLHGQTREELLQAIQAPSEWTPINSPAIYNESNVEGFAPDLAPMLKRYGLRGITDQTWQGSDGRLRVALFEMLDPSAAYGFFSILRRSENGSLSTKPIGAESFQTEGRRYFWQSRYVVRIDGPAAGSARMANAISAKILGRSRKPPVSNLLPPKGLVEGSDQYILSAADMKRSFGLDPAKLGFDVDVEVATADYRTNGKTGHVMLLLYPTQQIAKKYAEQLDPKTTTPPFFRKRVGPLVALVLDVKDAAFAESILSDVNYESKATWTEPQPGISYAEVLLTIFSFIGVALVFAVIGGISFGGLRIFVKARYPNRVFDRPETIEIIQLKINQQLMRKELTE